MMFISRNKVRMNDTDMAGILYFANQFRYAHDALEDFFESEGFTFDRLVNGIGFVFVIAHAEADYLQPLKVGDPLEVHVGIEKMGNTSISFVYKIYRNSQLVGTAKTVHVCLEMQNRSKTTIPDLFRAKFSKYLLSADQNESQK
jgi:1,4-dihydroxy-2-naphthoyl-CoA hydrolase